MSCGKCAVECVQCLLCGVVGFAFGVLTNVYCYTCPDNCGETMKHFCPECEKSLGKVTAQ